MDTSGAAPPEEKSVSPSHRCPLEQTMVTHTEILKRHALRWAILAAWHDDLNDRHAKLPAACAASLEKARLKIASGFWERCDDRCVLAEIEADLVSADGLTADCRASTWLDLLRKATIGQGESERLPRLAAI
jgi:hypothetical protein